MFKRTTHGHCGKNPCFDQQMVAKVKEGGDTTIKYLILMHCVYLLLLNQLSARKPLCVKVLKFLEPCIKQNREIAYQKKSTESCTLSAMALHRSTNRVNLLSLMSNPGTRFFSCKTDRTMIGLDADAYKVFSAASTRICGTHEGQNFQALLRARLRHRQGLPSDIKKKESRLDT